MKVTFRQLFSNLVPTKHRYDLQRIARMSIRRTRSLLSRYRSRSRSKDRSTDKVDFAFSIDHLTISEKRLCAALFTQTPGDISGLKQSSRTKHLIDSLPFRLKNVRTAENIFTPHSRRSKRVMAAQKGLPVAACLCNAHKPFNAHVIPSIMASIEMHLEDYLQDITDFVGMRNISLETTALIMKAEDVMGATLSPREFYDQYRRRVRDRWQSVSGCCRACVLSLIGNEPDILLVLRAVAMIAPSFKLDHALERSPPFLDFLECWINAQENTEPREIREESMKLAVEFLNLKKRMPSPPTNTTIATPLPTITTPKTAFLQRKPSKPALQELSTNIEYPGTHTTHQDVSTRHFSITRSTSTKDRREISRAYPSPLIIPNKPQYKPLPPDPPPGQELDDINFNTSSIDLNLVFPSPDPPFLEDLPCHRTATRPSTSHHPRPNIPHSIKSQWSSSQLSRADTQASTSSGSTHTISSIATPAQSITSGRGAGHYQKGAGHYQKGAFVYVVNDGNYNISHARKDSGVAIDDSCPADVKGRRDGTVSGIQAQENAADRVESIMSRMNRRPGRMK